MRKPEKSFLPRAEAPHTDFEDLSMVYRIRVPVGEDSFGNVLISNSMLERFGMDKEQLHQDAPENAPLIRPATVRSMGSVLGMLSAPPGEDSTLLVLTTEDMFKGAAALFYPARHDAKLQSVAEAGLFHSPLFRARGAPASG